MLQVGSKVRVKQNAFEGSDDPSDFLARGKVGEIIFSVGYDEWEVLADDGDYFLLTTDELEELEAGE